MPNQRVKPEKSLKLRDPWSQIFEEVQFSFVPTAYLGAAKVSFENGKIWEIDLTDNEHSSISELIHDIQEENQEQIQRLDFKINLDKIKKDVSAETARFLSQQ